MVIFILALAPAVGLLLYHRDRHPEPWRWVAVVFGVGALACLPTYFMERWAQSFFPRKIEAGSLLFVECLLIPGLLEESIKLLIVVLIIWRRSDFDEPIDGLIYGTAAALGFTFGEDLRYYVGHGADWSRIFSTAAHPWFSSFWAASLGWAKVLPRRQGLALVLLGLAASSTVHALFDFFILAAKADTDFAWLRHLLAPLLVGLYWLVEKQLEALQSEQPAGAGTH